MNCFIESSQRNVGGRCIKVLIKTIFEGDFVEEAKEGRKFHFEKRGKKWLLLEQWEPPL